MPLIKASQSATPPTATNGGAALGSDWTFTTTTYTEPTAGLSIDLPAAGTYLVLLSVQFRCQVSSGTGAIDVQLYDETAAAAVTGSERRIAAVTGQDLANWSAGTVAWLVTVTGASTVRLEGKRATVTSPVWVSSTLYGTFTRLDYIKLAT